MPKAKGKTGGKNRRRGKGDADGQKRELEFKEDGQEYAQVEKMLGNGRLTAQCMDGNKRLFEKNEKQIVNFFCIFVSKIV